MVYNIYNKYITAFSHVYRVALLLIKQDVLFLWCMSPASALEAEASEVDPCCENIYFSEVFIRTLNGKLGLST